MNMRKMLFQVILLSGSLAGWLKAEDLHVPEAYPTLVGALQAAQSGDRILLSSGNIPFGGYNYTSFKHGIQIIGMGIDKTKIQMFGKTLNFNNCEDVVISQLFLDGGQVSTDGSGRIVLSAVPALFVDGASPGFSLTSCRFLDFKSSLQLYARGLPADSPELPDRKSFTVTRCTFERSSQSNPAYGSQYASILCSAPQNGIPLDITVERSEFHSVGGCTFFPGAGKFGVSNIQRCLFNRCLWAVNFAHANMLSGTLNFMSNRVLSGEAYTNQINIGTSVQGTCAISIHGNLFGWNNSALNVSSCPVALFHCNRNDFIGNVRACVISQGGVDFMANYWGHMSGPSYPGNPYGLGDPVQDPTGTTLFIPWLENPCTRRLSIWVPMISSCSDALLMAE